MSEQTIKVDYIEHTAELFGAFDENVKLIEQYFNVRVISRESEIRISGEDEAVKKRPR